MSLIALIMNQCICHNFMKMSEIFINKYVFLSDYNVKLVKLYYIIEICVIVNIFSMHRTIIVNIRILVGSWPTCRPDQKCCMANHIIFKF